MKIMYADTVARRISWDTLQLNQAAILQGMQYHSKPVAVPCEYDERLRRRAVKRRQNKARATHAVARRRRR